MAEARPSAQALHTIQSAFEKFEATVNPDDKAEFTRTELKHVRDAVLEIEKKLAARHALRNMRRLQPFFEGLERYSKAVDVLCNGTPFLPWAWAPVKLLLQITSDFSGALEKLIEAYGKIADCLPRLDRLGSALKHDHRFQAVLALVYADILEFHRRAYKFVRHRSWRTFFDSMWGHFQSRFDSLLASLARSSELLDKEAMAVNISEAVDHRRRSVEQWEKQDTEWHATKLQAVLRWLKVDGIAPEDEVDKRSRDCMPDSCVWLIKHPKIKVWRQNKPTNPLVWLYGKPGAGKSVLCSALVQSVEKDTDMHVLYYFCTYLGTSHDSLAILRSIAAQALQKCPDLAIYIHDEIMPTQLLVSRKSLLGLLPKLLHHLGSVRLIVDGLDEWGPQMHKPALDDLLQLMPADPSSYLCKILISSRDIPTLSRNLQTRKRRPAIISLNEEIASIDGSIRHFITSRLDSYKTDHQADLDELDQDANILPDIERILMQKSNGMFLWVRLVLDSLENAYSPRQLRETIRHLPSDLSALYSRILELICDPQKNRNSQTASRILQWICFSHRPLNKYELLQAIALTPHQMVLDKLVIPIPSILEICKPLIVENPDGSVTFVHFSVQEFLASGASTFIHEIDAHHDLTFACTTLLINALELVSSRTSANDRLIKVGSGLYRLLPYALEFWTEHLLQYASSSAKLGEKESLVRRLSELRVKHDNIQTTVPVTEHPQAPFSSSVDNDPLNDRIQSISHLIIHGLVRDLLQFRLRVKRFAFQDGKAAMTYSLLHDPTLFSKLMIEFGNCVLHLLSQTIVQGLSQTELTQFKNSYASSAFRCRYPLCRSGYIGFATAELREHHERTHIPCILCKVPTCIRSRTGFTTKSGLDSHFRKYHTKHISVPVLSKSSNEPATETLTDDHYSFSNFDFDSILQDEIDSGRMLLSKSPPSLTHLLSEELEKITSPSTNDADALFDLSQIGALKSNATASSLNGIEGPSPSKMFPQVNLLQQGKRKRPAEASLRGISDTPRSPGIQSKDSHPIRLPPKRTREWEDIDHPAHRLNDSAASKYMIRFPEKTTIEKNYPNTLSDSADRNEPKELPPVLPEPVDDDTVKYSAVRRLLEPAENERVLKMADADDTTGKAPSVSRRKDFTTVAANGLPNPSLGSLPMGAMGQGLAFGVSGPEWEWLTMSL